MKDAYIFHIYDVPVRIFCPPLVHAPVDILSGTPMMLFLIIMFVRFTFFDVHEPGPQITTDNIDIRSRKDEMSRMRMIEYKSKQVR